MGSDSSFKRVKHGHTPGDISKYEKIQMREGKPLPATQYTDEKMQRRRMKSFQKKVTEKTKAKLREHTRREVERGLEEEQ